MSTYAAVMDNEAKLGIDIGGTGIKGAPVSSETGDLTADRFRLLTPKPATPKAVADIVAEVVKHFDYKGTVGCTFPAVVKHGVIETASNVDKSWIGTDAARSSKTQPGARSPSRTTPTARVSPRCASALARAGKAS